VIAAWVSGIVLVLAIGLVVTFWLLASNRSLEPAPPSNPPPIERPEPPKPGTLSVRSQPPGAAVQLDGQPTGQVTPARLVDLDRAKPHTLRLTLEGFQPWSKTVLFEEAQTVAMEAQLDELPKIVPPPPKPPPAPAVGTLNINAVPVWAYVTIDGSKQAQPTPLYGLKLKPGVHTVRLENPKLGWSKTEQVTIKKGETVDLVVKLK
jgi:hypothetical protein